MTEPKDPMDPYDGVQNAYFLHQVRASIEKTGYPPDTVRISMFLPRDAYGAFLKRYEAEPLRSKLTGKKIIKQDFIALLLWAWGKKIPLDLAGNIFDATIPGQTQPMKPKNPAIKAKPGRPKRQQSLRLRYEETEAPEAPRPPQDDAGFQTPE